jgi:hypothetical protein
MISKVALGPSFTVQLKIVILEMNLRPSVQGTTSNTVPFGPNGPNQ